ncbi:MAG: hypothetical protein ACOYN2_03235 [Patescibacteria group bacterium]
MIDYIKFDLDPYIIENSGRLSIDRVFFEIATRTLKSDSKVWSETTHNFKKTSKNPKFLTRIYSDRNGNAEYLFLLFKYRTDPSFIKTDGLPLNILKQLKDEKHGYLLIVHIAGYFFISKKHAVNSRISNYAGTKDLSKVKLGNYMAGYETVKLAKMQSTENKAK